MDRIAPFSYKSPEWKAARLAACQRAQWRCQNCGDDVRAKFAARVDHIKTVREAPLLAMEPSNLRVLCCKCDAGRHSEKGRRGPDVPTIGLDGYPTTSV